jgi:hypothetical protein
VDLDLRERCAALVDRSGSSSPFGAYVLSSSDPGAELGREVERVVFHEYFSNTPEMLADEYDPYEPGSMFLCVVDQRRLVPAGVMRVVVPSPCGLKSLDDISRVWDQPTEEVIARAVDPFDRQSCWDIATFAIAKEYRGAATEGLVSLALYQALVMCSEARGIGWYVAVMDTKVLDAISARIADPFVPFPGLAPKVYMDSPASVPVYVDIPAFEGRLADREPPIHEILFAGTGLEAAVWSPDWAVAAEAALPPVVANQAGSDTTVRSGRS